MSYLLAKLKPASLGFLNRISSLAKSASSGLIIAFCVGYAVSRRFSLPPTEVKNIEEFYLQNVRHRLRECVSDLNEILAFNIDTALNAAESLYYFRYNSTYPKLLPVVVNKERGTRDIFMLNMFFSKEILDQLDTNAENFGIYVNGIGGILDDIGKSYDERNEENLKGTDESHKDTVYVA